jgi:hypothetical protein
MSQVSGPYPKARTPAPTPRVSISLIVDRNPVTAYEVSAQRPITRRCPTKIELPPLVSAR